MPLRSSDIVVLIHGSDDGQYGWTKRLAPNKSKLTWFKELIAAWSASRKVSKLLIKRFLTNSNGNGYLPRRFYLNGSDSLIKVRPEQNNLSRLDTRRQAIRHVLF